MQEEMSSQPIQEEKGYQLTYKTLETQIKADISTSPPPITIRRLRKTTKRAPKRHQLNQQCLSLNFESVQVGIVLLQCYLHLFQLISKYNERSRT